MQVQLRPGLRRVQRGAGRHQIGVSPRTATVVDGLTPADEAFLDLLRDGVVDSHLNGPGLPVPRSRAAELVAVLERAGLVVRRAPARALASPVPRHRLADEAAVCGLLAVAGRDGWDVVVDRLRRRVVVSGRGNLAEGIAETLGSAGVGAVQLGERGAAHRGPAPDLVVLVHPWAADAEAAAPLVARDVPHLCVVPREVDVLVGPLVIPGDGPCLRCLDLHRAERDAAWPRVLAQLVHRSAVPPPEVAGAARLIAGLVTLQTTTYLDGGRRPSAWGATIEVELPDGLAARRPWPPHPECGCRWPPPVADDRRVALPQERREGVQEVRMSG